jgi:hypothetical protein
MFLHAAANQAIAQNAADVAATAALLCFSAF